MVNNNKTVGTVIISNSLFVEFLGEGGLYAADERCCGEPTSLHSPHPVLYGSHVRFERLLQLLQHERVREVFVVVTQLSVGSGSDRGHCHRSQCC